MWLSSCGDMNYYGSERKLTPQQQHDGVSHRFTNKQNL
nr:MAG TPA: hypothetical protein [Caudoviricetes sp.]